MFRTLLAFCLSLALLVPVLGQVGSVFNDNAGNFVALPVPMPGFRNIATGGPGNGYRTYSIFLVLNGAQGSEEYHIQSTLCNGACSVTLSRYSGPHTVTDPNLMNTQSNAGLYMIVFNIPDGSWLQLIVWYFKTTDNSTSPPTRSSNLLWINVQNPALPVPSSSTGPSVAWPSGRVMGLFIEDTVSSSFLPHASGWSWDEYDRDLTTYTLRVSFVYRLMEMDAFWIDPHFGDATLISTTFTQSDTGLVGNYLGSWDAPISQDGGYYSYNLSIPSGGTSQITLHYIYRIPGESVTQNQTVYVDIGNFYNTDSNRAIAHASVSRIQTLDIAGPAEPIPAIGEAPVIIIESTNANSASASSFDMFAVVVCALMSAMVL